MAQRTLSAIKQHAWQFCLIAGTVAVVGYFFLPSYTAQDITYSILGLASPALILVGVAINRPSRRMPWYLLAAGGLCFAIGDGLSNYSQIILHTQLSSPSVADVFYLAGYPFVFAAVLQLTRQSRRGNQASLVDAGIVMLAGLALSWHFLINPYVGELNISLLSRLVDIAYPLMDIALLYIILSRLLFRGKMPSYLKLLTASMLAMLVGDVIFDLLELHSNYATGSIVDGFFLLEYVLMAAAALHPSLGAPPAHTDTPANTGYQVSSGRLQLPVTVLAALVPSVLLFALYLMGKSVNIPVMLGLNIAMLVLIFFRVAVMIRQVVAQNKEIADYATSLEASHAQRDSLEEALRRQAFYDDLTGLPNRALFRDRLTVELDKARRSGNHVALCFGDLDGFAAVNNTLGHALGDSVLVSAAELLASIVRPGDTVARLGGDEFVVVMTDVPSMAEATEFAHRIVSTLNQSIEIEHNRFELSISVGVVLSGPDSTTSELTAQADAAMYEAKHAGKNTVAIFAPAMQAKLAQRLDISSGFRGALERQEFYLQYQPIHHLATGRLVGFEALARWDNPTLGTVLPDQFIDLAEESGFIIPLGRDLLDQACRAAGRWNAQRTDPLVVWVNLSRRQLASPDFVNDVAAALRAHGLPASQLGLEITENALIDDPELARSALTQLRTLGVRIAVDDFGTGYSSLSHLRQYPLDVLKIDKSFVAGLDTADPVSSALAHTIVRLATDLNLTTVAEGIETSRQREALTAMGCNYAQGYLFDRPLDRPAADLLVGLVQPLPVPALQS